MDICDTFNKKKFPKWFDFPGWHPQCRCVAVPITPKDSEMDEYLRKMVNGEDLSNWKWSGEVTELPAEFTGWMEENAGRLQKMQAKGNLPYFVRNNEQRLQLPAENKDEIKGVFRAAQRKNLQEWDDAAEKEATPLTQAQKENLKDVAKELGVSVGERMSFNDANNMHSNPKYKTIFDQKYLGNSYSENCTLCVMSHELRMRGLNVEAKSMNLFSKSMEIIRKSPEVLWIDPKTNKTPKWIPVNKKNAKLTQKEFERKTSQAGRYHVKLYWKGGSGHVFCVDRLPNGKFRFYDPQNGDINWNDWLKDVDLDRTIGIIKVDEMEIDKDKIKRIVKSKKSGA